MKKIAFILFLLIGATSMVVMSFHYFQSNTAGILRKKDVADSLWYLLTFRTHVSLGLTAIVIGPFQFIEKLRVRYPNFHKRLGYLYTFSVIFSALAGLIIAQYAMGGWITSVGFTALSDTWLYVTVRAITAIINGDILSHKKWMFLSCALTFSALMQRTLLLVPLLTDVPFMPIYQLSAWLPWFLNLMIGYTLFLRSNKQETVG